MTMALEDRVSAALVTGVGSPEGIGFAIATELVRAGLRVAITASTGRVHERAALESRRNRVRR
jgi:3-oxoacyl-[acyl-carrier protein] reductase